jgi:HlyD family secretion protein
MKKYLILGTVVVAAAIGGGTWWKMSTSAAEAAAAAALETAESTLGSIRQSVECTGRVVSNLDVEIKCKASGQIIGLPYDISDKVSKGDLLLEIDPVDQQRNLQQSEASLAASQARLAQARANLEAAEKDLVASGARAQATVLSGEARAKDAAAKAQRDEQLLAQKHISVEEAETSRTTLLESQANLRSAQADLSSVEAQRAQLEATRQEIQLAEVQIESDQAALELAKQRLTETKVLSPIDGVVSTRAVQIGQIVSSGISNVGGGTAVMTVSDLSRMYVLASVDESDIGNVVLGQETRVTVDAFSGEVFEGTVQRIANKGTNTVNVVTFEVKIELTGENKSVLKPEMTANVEIVTAEAENVVTVPIRALSRKGTEKFVTRYTGTEENEVVPVVTGASDGINIEIKSGIKEGEEVVLVRGGDDSEWQKKNGGGPRPPALFGAPKKKT